MVYRGFVLLIFVGLLLVQHDGRAEDRPVPVDKSLLEYIFTGEESLHYRVSWSGGLKIGDLWMNIRRVKEDGGFVIQVRVTDQGLFRLFYPVNDSFATFVRGPWKLPWRYEVHQQEGFGGRTVTRLTLYDQRNGVVRYRKNGQPWSEFTLDMPAYNEFSSFWVTRALPLDQPRTAVVPTFVDRTLHHVKVRILGREMKKTLFGEVPTIKVQPRMNFRGLYDKDGDTVFWITDNACRIPVEIRSKILIGSLVSELVEYSNTRCTRQGHPLPGIALDQ